MFLVRVTNGNQLYCKGRLKNAQILLLGIPFSLTLYSTPLTTLNLVLGVLSIGCTIVWMAWAGCMQSEADHYGHSIGKSNQ